MSKNWIFEKITELRGGDVTAQMWAKKIDEARRSGKLKAMVVKTPHEGADAFIPDAEIKDWGQIGERIW